MGVVRYQSEFTKSSLSGKIEMVLNSTNTCQQIDDDPDVLLRTTAKTIESVPTTRAWNERIVIGCWNVSFYLQSYIIVTVTLHMLTVISIQ